MRYAKEHKTETRRRIVQKASQRFREEGVDAVGVASLMASVGLTVGGFYAHFTSKEALVAEACNDGFALTTSQFHAFIETEPKGRRLQALVNTYLSQDHRDMPGEGCVIAANGAEIARHPVETRAAFTAQLDEWIEVIAEAMKADGLTGDACAIAGTMAGTMILARAVDDPVLSEHFLESGRRAVQECIVKGRKSAVAATAVKGKIK